MPQCQPLISGGYKAAVRSRPLGHYAMVAHGNGSGGGTDGRFVASPGLFTSVGRVPAGAQRMAPLVPAPPRTHGSTTLSTSHREPNGWRCWCSPPPVTACAPSLPSKVYTQKRGAQRMAPLVLVASVPSLLQVSRPIHHTALSNWHPLLMLSAPIPPSYHCLGAAPHTLHPTHIPLLAC